jgi:hypothetical protein
VSNTLAAVQAAENNNILVSDTTPSSGDVVVGKLSEGGLISEPFSLKEITS